MTNSGNDYDINVMVALRPFHVTPRPLCQPLSRRAYLLKIVFFRELSKKATNDEAPLLKS